MTTEVDLGVPLRIADLRAARDPIKVVVGPQVRDRVTAARTFLATVLGDDRAVYGATTGFGALVGYAGRADLRDQADNTLAHLGAGQGPDLDPEVVRATLLLRTASLARGASGVSPHVIDALAAMLATTFVPAMPRLGSVGASG
ncbi:aromatic amino acid lyase, partial [Micromonospora sp. NPDC005313]